MHTLLRSSINLDGGGNAPIVFWETMELERARGETGTILGDISESTQFRISTDSQSIIIDSLINLYEDPIGK